MKERTRERERRRETGGAEKREEGGREGGREREERTERKKQRLYETSLAVQWLRTLCFQSRGGRSHPGQRTKIPQAL